MIIIKALNRFFSISLFAIAQQQVYIFSYTLYCIACDAICSSIACDAASHWIPAKLDVFTMYIVRAQKRIKIYMYSIHIHYYNVQKLYKCEIRDEIRSNLIHKPFKCLHHSTFIRFSFSYWMGGWAIIAHFHYTVWRKIK